ncbi:hypothetical protein D5086_006858 [Populus alba]|uniref:Uncharacterized protein n=1 Tax=Populus alba TaxID=43335 RepID=A0ACC4CLR4_POPAL
MMHRPPILATQFGLGPVAGGEIPRTPRTSLGSNTAGRRTDQRASLGTVPANEGDFCKWTLATDAKPNTALHKLSRGSKRH